MSQDIKRALPARVKTEMNMLYTEPMFMTPTGLDFGLFCREHAYHTYFLCRLAGLPVEIVRGHYFVRVPDGRANFTMDDSGSDHAWCRVHTTQILDLSMTFHLTPDFPQLAGPVMEIGQNGAFTIRCYSDRSEFMSQIRNTQENCCIYYFTEQVHHVIEEELLANPYSFFLPPAMPGSSWADVFGPDIFAKITLHLHRVSLGHIKPLYPNYHPKKAVEYIRSNYKAALPQLREKLKTQPNQALHGIFNPTD